MAPAATDSASRVPRTALLLIGALATVVALSAALLALTLATLDRFESAEREVAHLDMAKHAAHIAEAQVREQHIQQVRAIIEDSLEHLPRYREAVRTTGSAIARLEGLVRLPDERQRTAEMAELAATIDRRFVRGVVPAIRAGRRAEVAAVHRQIEPLVRRITRVNAELSELLNRRSHAARSRATALRRRTRTMAVVCFGLALLVAVIVAAFLTRRIGGRVAALRAGAQQLARGDLAARIALDGKDEFGELATSFNRMAADLADHQRRLLHTERLASIGQVAAGVAHEINNPLAVIRGYVKVLQRKADAGCCETAAIIDEEARRCQRIVEDLLELARPQQLAPSPLDLLEIARDEVERLRNSTTLGGVRIGLPPADDLAPAWGDGEKLRQVLANLLTNAAEAAGESGTITISAGVEGDQTLLRIDDDGPGIAPDVLQRVFDPFFTTKDDGVGLGLAISRAIVDAHGGQIEAAFRPAGGTRITVRLPRSDSGAER